MQDVFYEETSLCSNPSKQKTIYYIYLSLSILFIIACFFYVYFLLQFYDFGALTAKNAFFNILIIALPLLGSIGLSFTFWFLKNRHCIDFDYTFISGSIRISKIIKQVKRKFICKFETNQIEKIGKVGSKSYDLASEMPNLKLLVATSNKTPVDGKLFYYMIVSGVEEKKLLIIFECTDVLISNVLKFSRSYVYEKD